MKLTKPASIFPALILTACYHSPSPPPPPAITLPSSVGSGQGLDLATDASEVVNELKNSGVEFVARYYREPTSRWPALSASEAQRLSSLGLKMVAVWESRSERPSHFSYSSGYSDAMTAYWEARALGQPAGSAIYFAVDFNPRSWSLAPIDQYFRGVAAGLAAASGGKPYYTVGVYGSGAVCDAVKGAGLARYSWLSNSIAWEGSTSYADWNIMQGDRLPWLSFNHDSDQAKGEYGAFQLTGYTVASYVSAGPPDFVPPQIPTGRQSLTSLP